MYVQPDLFRKPNRILRKKNDWRSYLPVAKHHDGNLKITKATKEDEDTHAMRLEAEQERDYRRIKDMRRRASLEAMGGDTPENRAYLESIKEEIRQKGILKFTEGERIANNAPILVQLS